MSKTKKLNKITKKLSPKKAPVRKKTAVKRSRKPARWKELTAAGCVLLVLLVMGVVLLLRNPGYKTETGAVVPPGARAFCIDISHHNGEKIIWDSLKVMTDRDGRTVRSIGNATQIRPVGAVYMKASEGESMRDRRFRSNWEEAGKRGIRRGAYHFFSPARNPVKQADNFIRVVGELRHADLPPVLDIEKLPSGVSKDELNGNALVWLRLIERHYGKKPVVYAPDSFIRDLLSKELKEAYPLWVAHYEVDAPLFKDYRMWQFTDKAVIFGIPGFTDLSIIRNQ